MKETYRAYHLLSSHKWTGPAEGVVSLCSYLKKGGHDVKFFCSSAGDHALFRKAKDRDLTPETDLSLSHKNPMSFLIDTKRFKRIMEKEKPDIVHTHLSSDHWIGVISSQLANTQTRVIRTIHHPNTIHPRLFRRMLYGSLTHGFITLSDSDRQLLSRSYSVDPKRIEFIHGAVDSERFHPDYDPRSIRAEFGIGASTPVIGMVARFQEHRGHEIMIRAMGFIKNVFPASRLILVGKGEFQRPLEQLVQTLNLEHNVVFAGYRDRDLPAVYAAMDLKVFLASGSDASCRAVLEGMACGLPIVAYPVGAVPETVVDRVTGYIIPPKGYEDLARSLIEILGDRNTIRKMGQAGRERIEGAFTEDLRARKTEEFYHSIIKDTSSPI